MKHTLLGFFTVFLMLLWNSANAVHISTVYQGTVPVASQSAADRNQALPQAFAETIVKVSGNNQVLNNPKLKLSLDSLNTLMQEFTYSASGNPARPYLLIVQFDADGINKLLRDASAPIWGTNRPLIVAWVENEIPNHPAEIIDSSSESDIKTILKQRAEQRGVPLILPVMDVLDLNQVSVNDIVTMTIPKLQVAAKRYGSDAILIIRVLQLTNGYTAQTKLQMGNDQWGWNVSGPSRADVLSMVINHVAETLAGRYSTVVTNAVQSKLELKITGVVEQNDFVQMMSYVQHLPPVAAMQVVQITGNDVLLSISLRGTLDSFRQILSGGQKLTPLPTQPGDKTLVYQWNH